MMIRNKKENLNSRLYWHCDDNRLDPVVENKRKNDTQERQKKKELNKFR